MREVIVDMAKWWLVKSMKDVSMKEMRREDFCGMTVPAIIQMDSEHTSKL